ncbi:MAG TPA: hypothetical protein VGF84_08795, partial [Micromonosporaceae bacterium]
MTNVAALLVGASADIVLGFIAVAVIVGSSVRSAGAIRHTYAIMAFGFGFGAASLTSTVVWVSFAGVQPMPLVPFAFGSSVQSIALLLAVLRLSTIVDGSGALARRGTEGTVIASCGAYALWTLMIEPLRLRVFGDVATLDEKTIGLLILAPSGIAVCICATVAWRCRSGAPGPLSAAVLAGLVGAAFVLLAAAFGNPIVTSAATFFEGACVIAAVVKVRRDDPLVPVPPGRSGTLVGWLPVSVAITACVIHLAIFHRADNTSILIATVIGASLAGRQTIIVRDL